MPLFSSTAFEAGTEFRPFCSIERERFNLQFVKECGLLNGCERITGLTLEVMPPQVGNRTKLNLADSSEVGILEVCSHPSRVCQNP